MICTKCGKDSSSSVKAGVCGICGHDHSNVQCFIFPLNSFERGNIEREQSAANKAAQAKTGLNTTKQEVQKAGETKVGIDTKQKVEIATLTYDNGIYKGECKDGKEHGHGTFKWANGNSYEGEWLNGKKHGYGTYTWANGDKWEGEWLNGNRTEHGTHTRANGDRHEGEFRDGNMNPPTHIDKSKIIVIILLLVSGAAILYSLFSLDRYIEQQSLDRYIEQQNDILRNPSKYLGKVTIQYNANGGSGAPSSHSVSKGENGYTLSSTKPTRSGYVFLGWRLDNDTADVICKPGDWVAISNHNLLDDTTLIYYAQWFGP